MILPLLLLYLLDLGGVGFLSKDEPRYASIGREMAQSGDMVTPRLNGAPWFEKPPLLYWAIALGRWTHLPDEWAARLPVALMSLAFLIFFFQILMREFAPRTAIAATTILATSGAWIAYSFVAVPDLPMSAALGAAMLIAVFDTRPRHGYIAGAMLGLAILAKAFVPLVLFAPVFLIARGKRLAIILGCVVVAAPWYLLCCARNGEAFWDEIFWKQQVSRFFTPALQHGQPVWFYIPVILAGMFPWTPLVGLLARRQTYEDVRLRFLMGWIGYVLLFFSVARNKLPGYILPLLPALAIVLAVALEKAGPAAKWWLGASGVLLAAVPMIAAAMPDAMLSGVTRTHVDFGPGLPFVAAAAAAWWLWRSEKPSLAMLTIGMAVVFAAAYVKGVAFGALDEQVSVRGFWRANHEQAANSCIDETVRREWEYGLNYYAGGQLPGCDDSSVGTRVTIRDGRLAVAPR